MQPVVSLIMAARNEAERIRPCLQALAAQTYPGEKLELIIADDRSTDKTPAILNDSRKEFHRATIIRIDDVPDGVSPKKYALSQALSKAGGEIIISTDADCTPPPSWILQIVACFAKDVGLVAGFAPFRDKPGILSKMLQLENFAAGFVAAGGIGWQTGITCTGRNLAYRANLITSIDGFREHMHSLSGDDDLLLQQVTQKGKWHAFFCRSAEAAVYSDPALSWRDYINQRRRHVSASRFYAKKLQFGYLLFNLANLCLWFFFVFGACLGQSLLLPPALFSLKLVLDFAALYYVARDLHRIRALRFFLLWEFFHLLDKVLISPLGFIGKIRTLKWKG